MLRKHGRLYFTLKAVGERAGRFTEGWKTREVRNGAGSHIFSNEQKLYAVIYPFIIY